MDKSLAGDPNHDISWIDTLSKWSLLHLLKIVIL